MSPDDRVAEILGEFRARRDSGEAVDAEALIEANPDLASRLRAEFTAMRLLNAVGARVALARGERPTSAPREGERFGPYRIVRTLGRGGSATVHLAEQEAPLQRRVALKVLHESLLDVQATARFDVEREALTRLGHPNVARVLDAGATADGQLYVVMEYVDGVDVVTYCERGKVTLEERLRLFTDVCDAVHHAHQKGLIHRDIKPANVLVTEIDGRPTAKVIDFGLAKPVGDGEARVRTAHGQVVGTPAYMSPEQARGQPVDTRTDVYALGMLLYELLTGDLPWDRSPASDHGLGVLLRRVLEEDPPKPSTRVTREVPAGEAGARQAARWASRLRGDLDWIVLKALAKEPERRYASAQALAEDVGRHLRHEAVEAGPPSATYRMRKFVRRHRLAVAASVVAVVALAAGLVVSILGVRAAERQQQRFFELAEFVVFDLEPDARSLFRKYVGDVDPADPKLTSLKRLARRLLDYCEGRPPSEVQKVRALGLQVMGGLLLQEGEAHEATRHLEEAIRLRPGWMAAHLNLGAALALLGDKAASVEQFEQARRLQPESAKVAFHHGCALHELGDLAGAAVQFRRALRLDPAFHDAALNLGSVLIDLGDVEGGLAATHESLRIRPDNSLAAYNLGVMYRDLRDWDQAAFHFQQAVLLHPGYVEAHSGWAEVLDARGDTKGAIEACHEALRLRPGYVGALVLLGVALAKTGRLEDAEARLREALDQEPDRVDAIYWMGRVRGSAGNKKGALACFRKILDLQPNHALAAYYVGLCLGDRGDRSGAEEYYRRALQSDPGLEDAALNLSNVLHESGDLLGAARVLREALDRSREFPSAAHNLGALFAADLGDPEGAVEHYREALRRRPGFLPALSDLGYVLLSMGDFVASLGAYGDALTAGNEAAREQVSRIEQLRGLAPSLATMGKAEFEGLATEDLLPLAHNAHRASQYGAAVRLFERALPTESAAPGSLRPFDLRKAAASAVLASAGTGGEVLDAPARGRLRRQSLGWVRAGLAALEARSLQGGPLILPALERWRVDPDLSAVRDEGGLVGLPPDEQEAWRALWRDLDTLRARLEPEPVTPR